MKNLKKRRLEKYTIKLEKAFLVRSFLFLIMDKGIILSAYIFLIQNEFLTSQLQVNTAKL
jgi:hypothetical protein